jgi:hypothetical protein
MYSRYFVNADHDVLLFLILCCLCYFSLASNVAAVLNAQLRRNSCIYVSVSNTAAENVSSSNALNTVLNQVMSTLHALIFV